MRTKLSFKLIGAFFLILAIVAGAMTLSRYLFVRNFETFIHQTNLEKLQQLVPTLQAAYRANEGWASIRSDMKYLNRLMHIEFDSQPNGPPPFKDEDRLSGGPPPPKDEGLPPGGPPPPKGVGLPPGGPPPPKDEGPPPGESPRILLFDESRQSILGDPGPGDKNHLVPIEVDGQVVGWLGLKKHEPFKSGPPADLFRRQTRQFYLLGGAVIVLTALVAFLFSRHLLKPIQHLIQGTRKLAGRDFSVRITPTTGDELSQLAEHFNAMAITLEEYEKMRRQWLTDISHELRTPLAVLRGEIEAIQDGVRKPTQDNMASLHMEILRINRLVEDLHLLSMADADSLQLNEDRISPVNLLETVVQGYQARLEHVGIDLTLRMDAIADLIIRGDAARLEQVFTNLMENALKYVQSPGTLEISGQAETGELILYFQDSGPGVPSESLNRLFDRLYRVDPSRNRGTGGSGLGLSICQQIIENHGGRIWAQHSPQGGLTIGIRLPVDSNPEDGWALNNEVTT